MMNIWSMFRHGTYYMIANDSDKTLETIIINYANTIGFSYDYEKHVYYITVNGNWVLDHKTQFGYLSKYIVPIEDFRNTEIGFHYTHLFGYLNPYYRSAYNIPKRRK